MRSPDASRAGVSFAFPAVQGSAVPAPAGAVADLARSFVVWLRAQALPFWARDGYDGSRARFCERLDEAGRAVVAMPHRLMVQARQVFVFAHAAHLGWLPEGAALAETAMELLLARYRNRPAGIGGFAFSVDADGVVVDDRRDAYGHAFVLFALAWLHRLDGDFRWLAFADETIEFLDLRLADSRHGGMFDAYPTGARGKRQNPTCICSKPIWRWKRPRRAAATPNGRASWSSCSAPACIGASAPSCLSISPKTGAIRDKPSVFEPGHHFEWIWLLRESERHSGADHGDWIEGLDRVARRHGVGADGLIIDEVARRLSPGALVAAPLAACGSGQGGGRAMAGRRAGGG